MRIARRWYRVVKIDSKCAALSYLKPCPASKPGDHGQGRGCSNDRSFLMSIKNRTKVSCHEEMSNSAGVSDLANDPLSPLHKQSSPQLQPQKARPSIFTCIRNQCTTPDGIDCILFATRFLLASADEAINLQDGPQSATCPWKVPTKSMGPSA